MTKRLSSEEKARRQERRRIGIEAAAARRARQRFYISFKCKGDWYRIPPKHRYQGTHHWPRWVWPKLFRTRDEAHAFIASMPVFANSEATAHRGRIESVAVNICKDLAPA